MAFVVETGAGTPGANALASVAFVTNYLIERERDTEGGWIAASLEAQQAGIVKATDYISTRFGPRLKGAKLRGLIPGREASGRMTLLGLPLNAEKLTVGQKVYRLVDVLAQENDVLIGADVAETIANFVAVLSFGGDDLTSEEHTLPNHEVFAIDESPALVIVALEKGDSGNAIAFASTITSSTITGAGTLSDGLDEGEQPLPFPRAGLYSRDGRAIAGVPLKVRQATAEYAVRAMSAPLSPDPTVDSRLVPVLSVSKSVGPLSTSTTYGAPGVNGTLLKPYPAADRLLDEYLTASGGVMR